jgi:hypothetical protein
MLSSIRFAERARHQSAARRVTSLPWLHRCDLNISIVTSFERLLTTM